LLGHHHHLVCAQCGRVEDIDPPAALEHALGEAVREVARRQGYQITEHRLDLEGLCPDCRTAR
ncbi:MAG: transcriptional repressor, partial [Candidatus Dormibacteraceae bacterium]